MYKEGLEKVVKKFYPDILLEELYQDIPIVTILSLDSLAFVKFIIEIEQYFDATFLSADIFDINITFGGILEIMERDFTNDSANS